MIKATNANNALGVIYWSRQTADVVLVRSSEQKSLCRISYVLTAREVVSAGAQQTDITPAESVRRK